MLILLKRDARSALCRNIRKPLLLKGRIRRVKKTNKFVWNVRSEIIGPGTILKPITGYVGDLPWHFFSMYQSVNHFFAVFMLT